MRFLLTVFLISMVGCADTPDGADGPEDAAPVNPYDAFDACPAFETGEIEMVVAGKTRTLQVQLPDNPEGAPVIFAWHWLNGSANETLDLMGVRKLSDEGYIVIAPESTGLQVEWDLNKTGDDNVDLALFDAALSCLWDDFQVDDNRIYATGHSAGGLMTTWLTMHRADVLAATAPFSGGTDNSNYTTPDATIPVLMTWGGPNDTYAGYNFHTSSLAFIDLLEGDGHYTAACEHTLGHYPPSQAISMLTTFLGDHVRGQESAWDKGIPDEMPAFCQ